MLKTATATVALLALSNPALAAGCATPADAAALKTAVMQQELMVAAFQCRETSAYNRFVTTYRGELQSSDAALKAFFVRRGGEHGEAGYDSFKTKAANLSALEQARNSGAFCADAHALFTAAFNNQGSLMSFVDSRSTDIGNICLESSPLRADAKPEKPANARLAQASPAEIGGVPAHNIPAIPYRGEAAPAPNDMARGEDMDDAAPTYASDDAPPPPPRYYQIRNRDYADRDDEAYAQRPYGPPPGWRPQGWRGYRAPQPGYGWYQREPNW